MYERFFGLNGNPFGMTPDPRFHFASAAHREALAALSYVVNERRGFMTLVGEVGTGKTTLINALLERLDRSMVTIHVTHTTVDREELLRVILHQLHSSQSLRIGGHRGHGAEEASRLAGLARIELVNELLDKGFAWERRNGHLYIIRNREYKEATTRRERDRNALIVTGEWDDRWMLYEQLRKVNDFPPKALTAIQRIFHEARVEVMKPGQLYENIDGEPVPKQ